MQKLILHMDSLLLFFSVDQPLLGYQMPTSVVFFSDNNIIITCLSHGFPRLSLATRLYPPSLLVGLLGYILYPHSTAVDKCCGPGKGHKWKTLTQILDIRLYYIRKIELHRKGKKSRTVRITPIVICPSSSEISVLIMVRRVHYCKMGKVPTTTGSSWSSNIYSSV